MYVSLFFIIFKCIVGNSNTGLPSGITVVSRVFLPHWLSQNSLFVLFAIRTSVSITGTSVSTPTVVARAAGLVVPKRATATATASSKKLEAPIIPAGAAISWGSFSSLLAI